MIDPKQATALMIVYGNESVWRAFKAAGIPQSVYQKLTMSRAWRGAQLVEAREKVKQIKEKGQTK